MFGSLAPNSQVVQSDDEILSPLRAQIGDLSNLFAGAPDRSTYLNDMASKFVSSLGVPEARNAEFANRFAGAFNGSGDYNGFEGVLDNYLKQGGFGSGFNSGDVTGYDQGAFQNGVQSRINGLQSEIDKQTAQRSEAAKRQTDAYGQMQGGNYFGGMMNAGYSSPAGGNSSTVGGLGGLGGMPTTETNPFAAYNATWSPEAQQHRAGSWGTPFGGW